tara:strand:- start:2004 stop:2705 length:702 start_codon:yes stop_codon:yes gene_type:complete
MNSKNKRMLLFLCLFIVIIIFLDMIFNFSGSIKENFSGEEKVEDFSKIKSVISKAGGRILNINVSEVIDENTSIINIKSPTHNQKNIEVINRLKLSENIVNNSSKNQQFLLKKIESIVDYNEVLEDTNRGIKPSTNCTKYPFYVIIFKDEKGSRYDKGLCYDNGQLLLDPLGNYVNQKWDVSTNITVNTMAQCSDVSGDSTNNVQQIKKETADKQKIKINFNLNDKIKDQLFS